MSASAWKEEQIARSGAAPLAARVYRPSHEGVDVPALVLHLHGGAFVAGDLDGGASVASAIAGAGAVVVSIAYPLAPAHPFPEGAEAAQDALAWLARQQKRLAGGYTHLYVAGEEAGGNLAAAAALMSRDRHGPTLAGQILLSPMLDVCIATASWRCVQAGPVGCPWADGWRQYLPRPSDATHPYATPGRSMRLQGLPATLLITAHDDPIRDETHAYAERLRAAGVAVDECVLPPPTGWPQSYLQHSPEPPPWSGPVRERVRRFIDERAEALAQQLQARSSFHCHRTRSRT